jgi:hypothetical protein
LLPDDKEKKLSSDKKHNTGIKIGQELRNNQWMELGRFKSMIPAEIWTSIISHDLSPPPLPSPCEGVDVGRDAKIKRTIVDKEVQIPPEMGIGYYLDEDAKRFTVTGSGIVVVPKGIRL